MAGVKGKSGRKPNERAIRAILIRKLDEIHATTGKTKLEAMLDELTNQAADGDQQAIREIMDRVDGKPKQVAELGGINGGEIPLSLTVKFE